MSNKTASLLGSLELPSKDDHLVTLKQIYEQKTHLAQETSFFPSLCKVACHVKTKDTLLVLLQIFQEVDLKDRNNMLRFLDALHACLATSLALPLLFIIQVLLDDAANLENFVSCSIVNFLLDAYCKHVTIGKQEKYTYNKKHEMQSLAKLSQQKLKQTLFQESNNILLEYSKRIKAQHSKNGLTAAASDLVLPQPESRPSMAKIVPKLNLLNAFHNKTDSSNSDVTMISVETERELQSSSRSAMDSFISLASKLGETYIAGDLTDLISIKRICEKQLGEASPANTPQPQTSESATPAQQEDPLTARSTSFVKDLSLPPTLVFKHLCLQLLDRVTRPAGSRLKSRNPVNLLLYELNYQMDPNELPTSPTAAMERENDKIIHKILANYAEDVPLTHSTVVNSAYGACQRRQELFFSRWNGFVEHCIEAEDAVELKIYLRSMSTYLACSASSVKASQCAAICLETLLKVQHFCKGRTNADLKDKSCLGLKEHVDWLLSMSYLFDIYTYMMSSPENHPLLMEFFFFNLLDNESNFSWVRHYARHLFVDDVKDTNALFSASVSERLQIGVVKYYQSLIQLLYLLGKDFLSIHVKKKRRPTSSISGELVTDDSTPELSWLMHRFDFLIHPVDGLVLNFLTKHPKIDDSFAVKREVLIFLENIFIVDSTSLLQRESYVNTYIRFHFLNFVKLYINASKDEKTLEMCTLHLKVLIAFSKNKTPLIARKFYQLKAVKFLSMEVDLEHQLQEMKGNQRESEPKPHEHSAPSPADDDGDSTEDDDDEDDYNTDESNLDSPAPSFRGETPANPSPSLKLALSNMTLDKGGLKKDSARKDSARTVALTIGKPKIPALALLNSTGAKAQPMDNPADTESSTNTTENPLKLKKMTPRVVEENQGTIIINQSVSARKNFDDAGTESEMYTHTEVSDDEATEAYDSDGETKDQPPPVASTPVKIPGLTMLKFPGLQPPAPIQPPEPEPESDMSKGLDSPASSTFSADTDSDIDDDIGNQQLEMMYGKELKMTARVPVVVSEKKSEVDFFEKERDNRKLYSSDELHVALLTLLLSLMITESQTLDNKYTDQHPSVNNMINIPFLLHQHINHAYNDAIIPLLHDSVRTAGIGGSILLRLLCKKLFDPTLYANKSERIGKGGYGTVWRAKLKFSHSAIKSVAVKLLPLPKNIHDRCVVHEIFNEILVMEKFKANPRVCRMYDYGVDNDNYYIVMREYKTSLRNWRRRQPLNLQIHRMPLYLHIFKKVLQLYQLLHANNVNHFDAKCDNIFIEPFDGVSDEEFWSSEAEYPCFEIVVGDFGESIVFSSDLDSYTQRHRGTECIKSPEMLKIERMHVRSQFYDRRKRVGASSSSDTWSLGCLLYELLTGEFLFDAFAGAQFYAQVTDDNSTLITQERYSRINYNNQLMDMLTYILIRDPMRRPSVNEILNKYLFWMKAFPAYEILYKIFKKEQEETGLQYAPADEIPEEKSSKVALPKQKMSIKPEEPEEDFTFDLATPHSSRLVKPTKIPTRQSLPLRSNSIKQGRASFGFVPKPAVSPTTTDNSSNMSNPLPSGKQPYLWSKSDILFYTTHESYVIPERLFISSDFIASDRKRLHTLGITHIVNCSMSTNANIYDNCFSYFTMNCHLSDQGAYAEYLKAFHFAREAIKCRGKVLVYSGKGLSRSVLFAILFVVHGFNLSTYEAYLFVKNHRPAMRPEILSHFLNFLVGADSKNDSRPVHKIRSLQQVTEKLLNSEHKRVLTEPAKPTSNPLLHQRVSSLNNLKPTNSINWYQCLCGSCITGLHTSCTSSIKLTSDSMEAEHSIVKSWPSFLEEMRHLYFFESDHVLLQMGTKSKMFTEPFNTEKHCSLYSSSAVPNPNTPLVNDIWNVYRCKHCSFMTHAIRNAKDEDAEVAVIANLPVNASDVELCGKIQDLRPYLFFKGVNCL